MQPDWPAYVIAWWCPHEGLELAQPAALVINNSKAVQIPQLDKYKMNTNLLKSLMFFLAERIYICKGLTAEI